MCRRTCTAMAQLQADQRPHSAKDLSFFCFFFQDTIKGHYINKSMQWATPLTPLPIKKCGVWRGVHYFPQNIAWGGSKFLTSTHNLLDNSCRWTNLKVACIIMWAMLHVAQESELFSKYPHAMRGFIRHHLSQRCFVMTFVPSPSF